MSSKKSEGGAQHHRKSNDSGSGSWRPSDDTPIFAPCTTYADEEAGTLRDATSTEVFRCCIARCKPRFDYCSGMCRDHLKQIYADDLPQSKRTTSESLGRCVGNCRIMNALCAQECTGMAPGFSLDNHYYKCAQENGCHRGLGQIPDKDCVKENKEVIFNCCRSKCQVATTSADCQEQCLILQDTILDPTSIGLPDDMYHWTQALENKSTRPESLAQKANMLSKPPAKSSPMIYPYLAASLGIGIIITLIIIIGLYWYRRKHK